MHALYANLSAQGRDSLASLCIGLQCSLEGIICQALLIFCPFHVFLFKFISILLLSAHLHHQPWGSGCWN